MIPRLNALYAALIAVCLIASGTLVAASPLEESDFVAATGKHASVMDALTATTFSAEMQARTGASFTGTTDQDIYEQLSIGDLDEKIVVMVIGNRARIITGVDAGHANVVQAANTYFTGLGFSVELLLNTELEPLDLLLESRSKYALGTPAGGDEPAEAATPEEVTIECAGGCLVGDVCLPVGAPYSGRYCAPGGELEQKKALGEPCAGSYECAVGSCEEGLCVQTQATVTPPPPEDEAGEGKEEKGFFGRIFSWFAGIFG